MNKQDMKNTLADILSPRNIKIALFVLFFLTLFFLKKEMFIILFFVMVGAVSMIYRLVLNVGIGFELCTVATVLCGLKYGGTIGILVGFLSVTIGMALNTRLFRSPVDSLYHMIGFSLIGYISSFFALENIFSVGMIIVVVYNLLYIPFRLFLGSNVFKLIIFVTTNIFLNYLIFKNLAPFFIEMAA